VIRVLVVDDQELVRTGLRHILRASAGFQLVAEAESGDEALQLLDRHEVDVVVMDVRMRDMDGVTATRHLRQRSAPPPVLILTTFDDDVVVAEALRGGASGFVLKDAPGEELQQAVRAVADGEGWLDPAVTQRVLATFRQPQPTDERRVLTTDLTARELDVLQLVGRGSTNTEIAEQLFISEGTVKTHLSHIFDKLGVRDRAGAIVYAFDTGLVAPRS
jgi:DNA-binding NarL/FixJ family response regulator